MQLIYRKSIDKNAEQDAEAGHDGGWVRQSIDKGILLGLTDKGSIFVADAESISVADARNEAGARHGAAATLLQHEAHGVRSAVMLVEPNAATPLVDGFPALPVEALDDRAEITIGGHVLLYRDRPPAEKTTFDSANDQECERCRRKLMQGAVILQCSVCSSVYHEGTTNDPEAPELECASYDARCGRCRERWDAMLFDPEGDLNV